jgi:hypothetical protein
MNKLNSAHRPHRRTIARSRLAVTAGVALLAGAAVADTRTSTWRGGTGLWTTAGNWTVSGPTTATETVYQIDGGNAVTSTVTLRPTFGTLEMPINRLTVSGGDELIVTDAVHLTMDQDVGIDGKVTLHDLNGGWSFHLMGVGQSVTGSGQISLNRGTSGGSIEFGNFANGSVTIGPNIRIRGDAGSIYAASANDTLNNSGTIDSDVVGGSLSLGAGRGVINNAGTVGASAGSLAVSATKFTNTGTVAVGTGGTVTLLGGWTNPGVISVADGGTLVLGGAFTDAGRIARSGNNVVKFAGQMDKGSGTLRFDASTGSWLMQSGSIKNATLEFVGGNQLTPMPYQDLGSSVENVTVKGNWSLPEKSFLAMLGTVRLDDSKVTLAGGAQIAFSTTTVTGTGEIVVGSSGTTNANVSLNHGYLTPVVIEAGITIHGGNAFLNDNTGFSGTGFRNRGVIDADVPGTTLRLRSTTVNEGVLRASAGTLVMESGLSSSNLGLIDISGGNVLLGGMNFSEGGRLAVSLDEIGADLPFIASQLILTSEEYLDLSGGLPGKTYQIGRVTQGAFGTFDHVTPGYTVNYDASSGGFFVTVVPEPSCLLLLGLPAIVGLGRRGRTRRI